MREIKFRAWDKYNKQMGNVNLLDWHSFTRVGLNGGDILQFDDVILMQYTGLKDKNGKEIYEGDIVKRKFAFYQDVSKVVFNDDICVFEMISIRELDNQSCWTFKKGRRVGFNKDFVGGFDYVEVIGNIHENPELIK